MLTSYSDRSYSDRLFLRGFVWLSTELNLRAAAVSLSNYLFGGIPFGGIRDRICDEHDAMYLEVLGMRFILREEEELILDCHSLVAGKELHEIDISKHLAHLLRNWPDGSAVSAWDV